MLLCYAWDIQINGPIDNSCTFLNGYAWSLDIYLSVNIYWQVYIKDYVVFKILSLAMREMQEILRSFCRFQCSCLEKNPFNRIFTFLLT